MIFDNFEDFALILKGLLRTLLSLLR
jgi:hypothetical protein